MVWLIIWFVLAFIAMFIWALSASLIPLCFVASAIVSIILAAFGVPYWIQLIVFFVIVIPLIVISLTVFKGVKIGKKNQKTNTDLLVGEIGVVQDDIDNLKAMGSVKVKFQIWTARSVDDLVQIKSGDHVKIVSIEGVKLICKKIDE